MRKLIIPVLTGALLASLVAFRISDGERWKAPEEAKKLQSPLKPSSGVIADGKFLFKQNCKACHGAGGKGDGEVSKTLKARCADLTSVMVQQQTDGELYYKLSAGRVEMPGFKDLLTSQERWSLIHYIRTLDEGAEASGEY